MLTLYRTKQCPRCITITSALEQLEFARTAIVIENRTALRQRFPAVKQFPVLVDEGKIYAGANAVLTRLTELQELKDLWYKFQSDACYCDEEGNVI
ncbi:MAG: hypothetical protein NC924_10120 [Candidatus Omnitrophica bacterium]|nr:hypothetical protein [Candidatus Omnitrophota bacterium]